MNTWTLFSLINIRPPLLSANANVPNEWERSSKYEPTKVTRPSSIVYQNLKSLFSFEFKLSFDFIKFISGGWKRFIIHLFTGCNIIKYLCNYIENLSHNNSNWFTDLFLSFVYYQIRATGFSIFFSCLAT